MATVTGFTAARMLVIENETIVDGNIVGDNLILETRAGTEIDAGNVRGPTGSPGLTSAEFNTMMQQASPIGTIVDYIGTVAPNASWLFMIGQTVTNGQTLHPELWAILPASMKSGANIIFPDTRGKMTVSRDSADADFDTIGDTGGSKAPQLPTHLHGSAGTHIHSQPAHTHDLQNHQHLAPSHSHSFNVNSGYESGAHNHNVAGSQPIVVGPTGGVHWFSLGAGDRTISVSGAGMGDPNQNHYHNVVGGTDGGNSVQWAGLPNTNGTSSAGGQDVVAASAGNTTSTGVTPTSTANVPPFIVFSKIIKVL